MMFAALTTMHVCVCAHTYRYAVGRVYWRAAVGSHTRLEATEAVFDIVSSEKTAAASSEVLEADCIMVTAQAMTLYQGTTTSTNTAIASSGNSGATAKWSLKLGNIKLATAILDLCG
jgi:hypothetical protein